MVSAVVEVGSGEWESSEWGRCSSTAVSCEEGSWTGAVRLRCRLAGGLGSGELELPSSRVAAGCVVGE